MGALTALETLRLIYIKIWKSHSCKIWIWNKALLVWHNNTEDQSIHLHKALWKDDPVPWKNLHVLLIVSKIFSNILEGLYSPVHVDEEHKGLTIFLQKRIFFPLKKFMFYYSWELIISKQLLQKSCWVKVWRGAQKFYSIFGEIRAKYLSQPQKFGCSYTYVSTDVFSD